MAQSEAGEVAGASLAVPATLIGGAFLFIAWEASPVGAPPFMAALAGVSRRTLRLALVAAIVWRVPLIFMPRSRHATPCATSGMPACSVPG